MNPTGGNDLPGLESRILQTPGLPASGPWHVAYSGGPDSTVLLHFLARICRQRGIPLVALHADHRLNPASADWRRHCEQQCREWGIECRTGILTCDGEGGPEARARRARYRWLARAAGQGAWVFTAHHREDQSETLLERLTRGAGPRGMRGILPVVRLHGLHVVRPLLGTPRSSIMAYAERHGLRWVEDEANRNPEFARNHIRHRVLPVLREKWPEIDQSLMRTAEAMTEAQTVLEDVAVEDLQALDAREERGEASLDMTALEQLAPARRRNALRCWIHRRTGVVLGAGRLARVTRVLSGEAGAAGGLQWPPVDLRPYRGRLYLVAGLETPGAEVNWDLSAPLRFGSGIVLRPGAGQGRGIGANALKNGATVRCRRGGEWCRLPGRPRRPLKKILQEAGIPPWQRARIPLIIVDGEIAAIAGVAYCAPFAAEQGEPGVTIDAQYDEPGRQTTRCPPNT